MASDDSAVRVELGLRGAIIAKAALELMSLGPEFAHLQLVEVVKRVRETDEFLRAKGFK
jgi:hypothetical protein